MTKAIRCADIVPGCNFEARADSEGELMQKVARHAVEAHGIQTVSPSAVEIVKSKIRDE